jgi:hypothetical protein
MAQAGVAGDFAPEADGAGLVDFLRTGFFVGASVLFFA